MNDCQPIRSADFALPVMGTPVERGAFFALLNQAVRFAEAGSAPVLVLMELTGLGEVAARHGPHRQDALAQAAALRIAAALGDAGYVCMLRNHRLAALVASDGKPSLDTIATRLLAHLAVPIAADGIHLTPGTRLGMAQWDVDGVTVDELLVAADVAMQSRAETPSATITKPAPFRFVASPLALRA
jgi:GGDEF domain-containing protein